MSTDGLGPREEAHDLLRPGCGCDVEVLGGHPQQEIAHAAAREIGFLAVLPKASKNGERGAVLRCREPRHRE